VKIILVTMGLADPEIFSLYGVGKNEKERN